jgi:hypothetical protein
VDTSAIIGVVFHDLNQNGVRDFGEIGLPGAVISLTLGGSLVDTRTTSGTGVITGTFTFTVPRPAVGVPVVYGLHETNPVGYRSTTPDDLNLVVTSLQTAYQVEFGDSNDPGPAFVYGIVYEDANKNGEQEPTEIGISGVSVSLYDPVLDSTVDKVTNAWGTYSFLVEDPGVYVISETDPDGYLSTTPNEVHVSASLGENYRVDFGDVLRAPEDFAVIHGTVFHDGNGNGVYDLLESGIGGVLITLDGLYTATTDIYGGYTFSTTVAGTHTLVESDLEGYFSTTPNEVHVSAALGGEYRVDFGDGLKGVDEFASIHGTVFHDEDQDGIWDAAEPGIPGVSITLDGSAATTTDVYGSYAFTTTLTGAHTVVETDLPKHISTTPNTVDVVDVLVGEDYLVNFGDKYQEFFFYFPIMGVTSGSP